MFGWISYYIRGLFRQGDAQKARDYLGITGLPGSGTVTTFSSGNLSPLFTTSVANPASTPAQSFSLSTQLANLVFAGPTSGGAAAPTFRSFIEADMAGFTDITTGNATTAKHGLLPKLSGVATEYLDGSGNWSVPAGGGGGGADFTTWREAIVSHAGTAAFQNFGTATTTVGTLNFASGTATAQPRVGLVTATSLNADASVRSSTIHNFNLKTIFAAFCVNGADDDRRVWVGLTEATSAQMLASDAPAFNFAAFRYSQSASDSNWQAVTGDGASTTVVDTGVSASGVSTTVFEIRWDEAIASVLFYINGVLVATIAATLPSTASNFSMFAGVRNLLAGTIRGISVGFARVLQQVPSF